MGCIYRIYCAATGRSYIGQTAYSQPFTRFMEHQATARSGEDYNEMYDDLRAYGVHEFECSCICVVPNEMLNALEAYYAEQYDAYVWDGGYNVGECGRARVSKERSDEDRKWAKRRALNNARRR